MKLLGKQMIIKRKIIQVIFLFILAIIFGSAISAQINKDKKRAGLKIYKEALKLVKIDNAEAKKIARDKFKDSLALFKEANDQRFEALVLSILSRIELDFGNTKTSIEYVEQAIPLLNENKKLDKHVKATTYGLLGDIYRVKGENLNAIKNLEEALRIYKDIKQRKFVAGILNNLAVVYSNLGQFTKALERLDDALKTDDSKDLVAPTFLNKGEIYLQLGLPEVALDQFNKSLAVYEKLKDKGGKATALNNIGMVFIEIGVKEQALEAFEEAKKLYTELEDAKGLILILNNIGGVYWQSDKQTALKSIIQSLEISRKNGMPAPEELVNIGVLNFQLGQEQKGADYLQEGLFVSKNNGLKNVQAAALTNLMQISHKQNNNQLAIVYGKQAIDIYQEFRLEIKPLTGTIKSRFLESVEHKYRYLANILISEGRLYEAQLVLDLLKEEEFSVLTSRSGKTKDIPYFGEEEEILKIVSELAKLAVDKRELQSKSILSEKDKADLIEIQNKIKLADDAFRRTLNTLSDKLKTNRNFDSVVKDSQAFTSDLKKLGSNAVALYTVIHLEKDKSNANSAGQSEDKKIGWIILITPDSRKAFPIDVMGLEEDVYAFRDALIHKKNTKPLAQKLYRKLFLQTSKEQNTTLAAELDLYLKKYDNKVLMWSLDGVLRYIPIAALHDGEQYLLERYNNVVFNTASKARLNDPVSNNWTVFGLGVTEKRKERGIDFPALPGAENELQKIIADQELTGDEGILTGSVRMNDRFDEKELQSLLFKKYPVIHIASHFKYNIERGQSFLLLGKGYLTDDWFRGNLRLFDEVDLITLAACDTAMGKENGEEAEGFAYLAQDLGAKAVLASLWNITDIGSDELLIRFYQIRKDNPNLTKGEAFRNAQLALLNDSSKPYSHPHYWSSFILIGNWK